MDSCRQSPLRLHPLRRLATGLGRFRKRETGAIGVFGLYIFSGMAVVSAFALDTAYLWQARNQLQVAADAAAHAALYYRDLNLHSADEARVKAISVAHDGMPGELYGELLKPEDIVYGTWDRSAQAFTVDENSRSAVMVQTKRLGERANAAQSFLFRLMGFEEFDVVTTAVFTTFRPTCFREGFVADDVVDIQSNNGFSNGFCIHSNTYVSVNSNNTFEPGTIVSMPNQDDVDLPRSGFKTNDGLQAALRSGVYQMRLINQMDYIYEQLLAGNRDWVPASINQIYKTISGKSLNETHLQPGYIYRHSDCGGNGLTLSNAAGPLSGFVLITDCKIKFANGTRLEDVIIATYSTDNKSVNGPSGVVVGRDDNCADGGSATILTYGGMDFAADLHMYGGRLVAKGNIAFAANADGIEGASMIAMGQIEGTSNMDMGFCGTGMDTSFEADYFRLAL